MANIHAKDANTNIHIDINSGMRRPNLSLSGPITTCPAASPIMQTLMLICTQNGVVENACGRLGKDGRYISVTKGPNADNPPRVIRNKILLSLFIKNFALSA